MRISSIIVRPGIRNLLNSTVGHLCSASAKQSPERALETTAIVPLHPITSSPPRDMTYKYAAAQQYIFKILNMKTPLKLKITMFRIYLEDYQSNKTINNPPQSRESIPLKRYKYLQPKQTVVKIVINATVYLYI
jgi:hypothetical protein